MTFPLLGGLGTFTHENTPMPGAPKSRTKTALAILVRLWTPNWYVLCIIAVCIVFCKDMFHVKHFSLPCYNTFVTLHSSHGNRDRRRCIMENIFVTFLISVVASVVSHYLCKWLDRWFMAVCDKPKRACALNKKNPYEIFAEFHRGSFFVHYGFL